MLDRYLEADPEREWLPVYNFNMLCEGKVAGRINLRIGNPDRIILYRGHIGYAVNPESRGRHFAARSVKLLLPFAADHGLNPIWITCNTDNVASRRTCEIAGAELVEIIDIPPDEETYKRGIFQKCRYRLYTV
ncbi:MAG: GNAT family N-acetyltransferase [Blastocatellia bacterium]|nr:GNAT family N-acetyltransferase [Blastocatellia bacterium]